MALATRIFMAIFILLAAGCSDRAAAPSPMASASAAGHLQTYFEKVTGEKQGTIHPHPAGSGTAAAAAK